MDGHPVGIANSPALWLSPLFTGVLGLPEKRTMMHLLSSDVRMYIFDRTAGIFARATTGDSRVYRPIAKNKAAHTTAVNPSKKG